MKAAAVVAYGLAFGLLGACTDDRPLVAAPRDSGAPPPSMDASDIPQGPMTRAQLLDPETCKGCHPTHYREWSSSMHAYAAMDPVFIAMNARGQRETNGALGDFCVKCHAPMAVAEGLTTDGLNLAELPDRARGVSCYFCHNAVSIDGDHNGMLRLANDTVMRGPIEDPVASGVHESVYSDLFDHDGRKRNQMCGACHDVVTPNGVHLERTYQEYLDGFFSFAPRDDEPTLESCPGCHMPNRTEFAAVFPEGVRPRVVHEHLWPGIDTALVDFPNKEAMRSAIEDCQLGIGSVQFFTLEVTPPNVFTFKLETNAGHNQPSGAAQDRRMWLELLAYDDAGNLIESSSSGNIGDLELEEKPAGDPRHDPQLWMMRDYIYDANGKEVHMFWDAAPSARYPTGYVSKTLAVRTEFGIGTHYVQKEYRVPGADGTGTPARVTARLKIRPIGMDILQDLVDSGDLDPAIMARMPTFTFGAQLEWTRADGFMNPISATPKTDCKTYRCILEPGSMGCD